MIRSRRAIRIAIIYSIPLLLWLSAQLRYIEWDAVSLHLFFRQVWAVLILLQVFSLALIFANRESANMNDDLLAAAFVLLYPLPFLALVWLTGSASFAALTKGCAIVAAAAAVAIVLQRCAALFSSASQLLQTGLVSTQLLPAIVIWNFRHLWLGWLGA
jgi:hypothetical protein